MTRTGPHLCALPVHMDGSCTRLQHYAALGRDREGGKQVCLLLGMNRAALEGVRALVAEKVAADARSWVSPSPPEAFGVALEEDPQR